MMKKLLLLTLFVIYVMSTFSQNDLINPEALLTFKESPQTHNMHITSDGQYYYTCNGGIADKGQIQKFSLQGVLLQTYSMKLDMRSIMFNPTNNSLYVSGCDKNIYRITSLTNGSYETQIYGFTSDCQSTTALSADGKYIFDFYGGTLKKCLLAGGQLINTYTLSKYGAYSNYVVAVDETNIYTWDSEAKQVFAYDQSGNFVKSFYVPNGNYSFSLSIANGNLLVSTDGNYSEGTWYAYKIKNAVRSSNSSDLQAPVSVLTFKESPQTHNMHITSDGQYYYTCNGGIADKGQIQKFSLQGVLLQTYSMKLDMRSIMYNPTNHSLYVSGCDRNIYKITNLSYGSYSVQLSGFTSDCQSVTALSPDGMYIYDFYGGTLKKCLLSNGQVVNTYYNIKSGEYSNYVVAADDKNIYTWDASAKLIYVYDLTGNFVKSFTVPNGDYSFSLSIANNNLLISTDGNYGEGTWYAYKIKGSGTYIKTEIQTTEPGTPAPASKKK